MHYCTLGNTGLTASKLGFGTMRLPIDSIKPDFTEAVDLIQYAIDKGINFFDVGTFYCHGHCENVYGLATSTISSEKLLVCGKNTMHLRVRPLRPLRQQGCHWFQSSSEHTPYAY